MGTSIESPAKQQQATRPSSGASSRSASPSSPALCRYKTGRCPNARAAKTNGALLLLCEFHRRQQNRTKKRSDTKYRHDRARKRMVERQVSGDSSDASYSSSSESAAAKKHLQPQPQQRLCRRASPLLTSPSSSSSSSSKRSAAWPPDDVRLLAYFLL